MIGGKARHEVKSKGSLIRELGHARPRASLARLAQSAGSTSVNVDPTPGVESTSILPAEQLGEPSRDVQPEPRSAVSARQPGVELREGLEQSRRVVGRDADARCRAPTKQTSPFRCAQLEAHLAASVNFTALPAGSRESGESCRCRSSCGSASPGTSDANARRFWSRQRLDDRGDSAHEIRGEEIGRTHRLATFVEAGERQDLFDHGREMLRHRAHALEHVELALGHRPDHLIGEQLAVAGERGERRAQLVRDRREESALRAVGGLRLIEQLRLPQRQRRVVGDDAQTMRLASRERLGAEDRA